MDMRNIIMKDTKFRTEIKILLLSLMVGTCLVSCTNKPPQGSERYVIKNIEKIDEVECHQTPNILSEPRHMGEYRIHLSNERQDTVVQRKMNLELTTEEYQGKSVWVKDGRIL